MALSFPNGSVTQDGWNVSRTLSSDLPKGGRLSVFRGWYGHDARGFPKFRLGDHDGRTFESEADYVAFVRAHGYVKPHLRQVGAFKAQNRANIRRWTRELVNAVKAADSCETIVALADKQKQIVRAAGCDILDSMRFGNAAYVIARKFRPELCPPLRLAA